MKNSNLFTQCPDAFRAELMDRGMQTIDVEPNVTMTPPHNDNHKISMSWRKLKTSFIHRCRWRGTIYIWLLTTTRLLVIQNLRSGEEWSRRTPPTSYGYNSFSFRLKIDVEIVVIACCTTSIWDFSISIVVLILLNSYVHRRWGIQQYLCWQDVISKTKSKQGTKIFSRMCIVLCSTYKQIDMALLNLFNSKKTSIF